MDWPRAKAILIVAFTALNVYLAYHLYAAPLLPPLTPTYLAIPSESRVEEALAPYGVQTQLPDRWPTRLVSLTLEPIDLQIDPRTILDPDSMQSEPAVVDGAAGTIHTADTKSLFIADEGWVLYTNSLFLVGGLEPLDVPTAIQSTRQFIDSVGGFPGGLQQSLVNYDSVTESLGVRYEQQIAEVGTGNLVLFDGIIDVRITSEGVSRYQRRLWTVTGNASDEAAPIVPITTLLLRSSMPGGALHPALEALADRQDDRTGGSTERMLQAELGYAVKEEENTAAPPKERLAHPVWRVTLGQQSFYFDAVTGEYSGGHADSLGHNLR